MRKATVDFTTSSALSELHSETSRPEFSPPGEQSGPDDEKLAATAPLLRTDANAQTIVTSSISNTVQASSTPGSDGKPDNSARPTKTPDATTRVLVGVSACFLLGVVALAVFSKNPVDEPTLPEAAFEGGPASSAESTEDDSPAQEAPSLAAAPFDSEQALTHQQEWAEHLSLPVAYTHQWECDFSLFHQGGFLWELLRGIRTPQKTKNLNTRSLFRNRFRSE